MTNLVGFLRSALLGLTLTTGCGSDASSPPPPAEPHSDVFDGPISALSRELRSGFNDGDLAFSTPLREADGLGPLYTRSSCDACHAEAIRGPGLVQKMSVVEADGVTPALDQSALAWGHTVHPLTAGGGTTPVLPPEGADIKVTIRVGPPVLGRGYMEAVADSEIERMAAEQATRTDGIHGRVNRVLYASEPARDTSYNPYQRGDTTIGRFGLKARIATLDEFTADAFQGDMGITSPYRPEEFVNPDGLKDDAKPGIDVGYGSVESRALYLRLLAIPERYTDAEGAKLFEQTSCGVCHTPSLKTRADYPIANLAAIDAHVYTDFLIHDMGPALADGLPAGADIDGGAGSFEWRTSPLIGLRFNRTFLHDGRAKSVEEAIAGHRGVGSEANDSIDRFDALSASERASLIAFVEAL
jgi:CxxC motif-containing protein (DUF1111 family)